jgi:hypothetical protein
MDRLIRSGDPIATGTGEDRRRLTLEEAEAGGLPEPMTREEWTEMTLDSRWYHDRLIWESYQRNQKRR